MSQSVADMIQECKHNMSQVADTIRELEDELWQKEQCVQRLMEEMDSQLTEFRSIVQAKNKIISELEQQIECIKMA
jgi:chromosome segregation ATPase